MARLYANENFPRQVVEALRSFGHDVLTVAEAGNAGQGIPDTDVLMFATRNERAVITLNRWDFIQLHARMQDHAGIIVCTQDPDIDAQAKRIHEAILKAEPMKGSLIRVIRQ